MHAIFIYKLYFNKAAEGWESLGSRHFSLQILSVASNLKVKANASQPRRSHLLPSLPSVSHSPQQCHSSYIGLLAIPQTSQTVPTSGPFHMLFAWPGNTFFLMSCPGPLSLLLHCIKYLIKCYLSIMPFLIILSQKATILIFFVYRGKSRKNLKVYKIKMCKSTPNTYRLISQGV